MATTYPANTDLRVSFHIAPKSRRVRLLQAGYFVTDQNGQAFNWPVRSNVWVDPAAGGYIYDATRTLPAGTYSAQAGIQRLDGTWKRAASSTFAIGVGRFDAVAQIYLDVLGRRAGVGESDEWVRSAATLDEVRAGVIAWRDRYTAIAGLYQSILGWPDNGTGPYASDSQVVTSGYQGSDKGLDQIGGEMRDYKARLSDPSRYDAIAQIYHDYLHRAPYAGELGDPNSWFHTTHSVDEIRASVYDYARQNGLV